MNEIENTAFQNIWDIPKTMFKEKFIAIKSILEIRKINNFPPQELKKKEGQGKYKASRNMGIVKIRVKMDVIEYRKTIKKVNESKYFLKRST